MCTFEISDVISILAFMMSGLALYVQYYQTKKTNLKNLEIIYFNSIFKSDLIYKIPNARRKIWVDEKGNIKDDKDLIFILNNIRKKSIYFKYTNEKFYNLLCVQLQGIEDFITEQSNNVIDNRDTFNCKLTKKLELLYEHIIKYYNDI